MLGKLVCKYQSSVRIFIFVKTRDRYIIIIGEKLLFMSMINLTHCLSKLG